MAKVIETTGLARSTIYKLVAKQQFPKPISISQKAVGWLESDIQKWIEDRVIKSQKVISK